MLTEIKVSRFKAIEVAALPLEHINLVIGSNNSGKSSFLQAIQFSISVAQTMKRLGAEWKGDTLSHSFSSEQLVYSPVREVASLKQNLFFAENYLGFEVSFSGTDEAPSQSQSIGAVSTTNIHIGKGRAQNLKCKMTGFQLGNLFTSMNDPYSVFVPGLAGIPKVEEFHSEALVRKASALGDANSVFRNVLWLLRQNNEQWLKFNVDFRRLFPDYNIRVSFDPKHDEFIKCEIVKTFVILPIDAAGTGILQAIQILSYIHLYKPKLLILDEPDAHLHPDNQRKLIKLISEIAVEQNFQVIISSHSRHVLDELTYRSRKHWLRNGKRVDDAEYGNVEVLFEIGALDRGDLLGAGKIKCVVLTEDSDTQFLKVLLSSNGLNMSECEIWSYKGCSNLETALALANFVVRHSQKTRIFIHRDRDYLSEVEVSEFRTSLGNSCTSCTLFITDGTDIESHFLGLDHLCAILTSLNRAQIEALVKRANEDTAEESLKIFIRSRFQIDTQRLRRFGKQVDIGECSVACTTQFNANSVSLRHGKLVLSRLRFLLKSEHNLSTNLVQSSKFLGNPAITALAKAINDDNAGSTVHPTTDSQLT